MRNLLLLFRKYGTLILFLLLEGIAFFLIVNFNNKQKEIFLYSSNLFSGAIMQRVEAGVDYFNLSEINDSIAQENARLLGYVFNDQKPEIFRELKLDSSLAQYELIPAKIANKTINLRNNRMTLSKGSMHGIKKGMGVLSTDGIIGVVQQVNSHYSSVMPIVNTRLQVSVKIKSKDYFGDLVWQPYDERYMQLKHIPKHATIAKGDTVITSGYSTIFPGNIPIAEVERIALPSGSNYFDISVRLFTSLSNLEYVYVVDNKLKELQQEMDNIE